MSMMALKVDRLSMPAKGAEDSYSFGIEIPTVGVSTEVADSGMDIVDWSGELVFGRKAVLDGRGGVAEVGELGEILAERSSAPHGPTAAVEADDEGMGAGGGVGDGDVELELFPGDGLVGEFDVESWLRREGAGE
jgi:hypothetical protein